MTKSTVCIDAYGEQKMKKCTHLLLIILLTLSLCSCDSIPSILGTQNDSLNHSRYEGYNQFDYYIDSINIEYKKDKNFIIYTDANQTGYIYIIKNNYGEQIDFGYHNYRGSFDIYEKSGLLVLDYGFGGNSWQERYYDVEQGRVSRFFQNPLATYNENISYFIINPDNQNIYLVIQNIFNPSIYYEEILWEYSSTVFRAQPKAQFLQNGTKLKISYYDETTNEFVTQIVELAGN